MKQSATQSYGFVSIALVNDIIEQLGWRYATKHFDANKKIDDDTWQKIEQSLVLTPSSYGLQPWKFIVVKTQELKDQLLAHSWGQKQVAQCSHFVVLCALRAITHEHVDRFIDRTHALRGGDKSSLDGYSALMKRSVDGMDGPGKRAWADKQVYLALGQLMAVAATLSVDACPMEGIVPPQFDKVLGLETYATTVACAMGYRSADDKYGTAAKVRFAAEDIVEQR